MAVSSLFSHASAPGGTYYPNEAGTYSLGVVIRPNVSGEVTSIWYYVGANGLGTIAARAHIYDYAAVNVLPGETNPYVTQDFMLRNTVGWQEVVLNSAVSLNASTRYVVSISFPAGNAYYNSVANTFSSDVVSGDLIAESQASVGNGRYSDNGSDQLRQQFPAKNFAATSYCVDVTFSTNAGPAGITHFRVIEGGQLAPMSVEIVS